MLQGLTTSLIIDKFRLGLDRGSLELLDEIEDCGSVPDSRGPLTQILQSPVQPQI